MIHVSLEIWNIKKNENEVVTFFFHIGYENLRNSLENFLILMISLKLNMLFKSNFV